ncbi:Uncharacterized protein SCF082_LOCUS7878 [Durusdinium trenchii]|uniref:Uncharacterized protein n=1 Tax=Durusdinium trenchii TaxID=1381693 RepID=A0ABP0IQY4_9DINO
MPLVMLKRNWPASNFRRTIKADGEAQQFVFNKDAPVELTDAQFAALGDDLGNALIEAHFETRASTTRPKPGPPPQPTAPPPTPPETGDKPNPDKAPETGDKPTGVPNNSAGKQPAKKKPTKKKPPADDDADTMLDIFGETITHRAQASPLAETEIVAFVERKMSQQDDSRGLGILERAEIQIRTGDVSLTLRDSFVVDSTEMFVDSIGLTAGGLTSETFQTLTGSEDATEALTHILKQEASDADATRPRAIVGSDGGIRRVKSGGWTTTALPLFIYIETPATVAQIDDPEAIVASHLETIEGIGNDLESLAATDSHLNVIAIEATHLAELCRPEVNANVMGRVMLWTGRRHKHQRVPRHFGRNRWTNPGSGGYRYRRRSEATKARKEKRGADPLRPNYVTGNMLRDILSSSKITSTATRWTWRARNSAFPLADWRRSELEALARDERDDDVDFMGRPPPMQHSLYDAIFGALTIRQITEGGWNIDPTTIYAVASGGVDPEEIYAGRVVQVAEFTTADIAGVLGGVDPQAGLHVTSGNTVPFRKRAVGSTFASGSSHFASTYTNGLLLCTQITASRDSEGEETPGVTATLQSHAYADDGEVDPVTASTGQALAAQAFNAQFAIGPVVVNSTEVTDVTEWRVDTGITLQVKFQAAKPFPIRLHIRQRRPRIEIDVEDLDQFNSATGFTLSHGSLTSASVYARRRDDGNRFEADDASNHAKISFATGITSTSTVRGTGNDDASGTVILHGKALSWSGDRHVHWQVWIPEPGIEKSSITAEAHLERVGLAHCAHNVDRLQQRSPDPSDPRPGWVYYWPSPRQPHMLTADALDWRPAVAHDGFEQGRYLIGLADPLPNPDELKRPYQFPGIPLRLDDGRYWVIPTPARLPQSLSWEDDGSVRFEQSRRVAGMLRSQRFLERTADWQKLIYQEVEEGTIDEAEVPWQDLRDFAFLCLTVNYRITPEVCAALQLLTEENARTALYIATGAFDAREAQRTAKK